MNTVATELNCSTIRKDIRVEVEEAIISSATGFNFEKYQCLIEDLVAIDVNGDVATEKAKIEAIVW